ncbi:hypothetical protein KBD34_04900 [Patescibacteria group bacterium]|nr:hypothetical protein [Patescibacteria group bacterium]
MNYLKRLEEVSAKDILLVGGKAASLGELIQAGLPVPNGFVILTSAFVAWIRASGYQTRVEELIQTTRDQNIGSLEHISEQIRSWLLPIPLSNDLIDEINQAFQALGKPLVAVRSSAQAEDGKNAAWAGQLETYLCTTKETLLQHVKECWISLFSPRALTYALGKKIDKIVPVAVIVQSMVESEGAGVVFSVHPVSKNENQLIIEASYGLGEAIVSGQVTPDSFVVQKEPPAILEQQISTKTRGLYRKQAGGTEWKEIAKDRAKLPVLSEQQILELASLVMQIERQSGFPCDIEWAMVDEEFFILQSRPITTLGSDSHPTRA